VWQLIAEGETSLEQALHNFEYAVLEAALTAGGMTRKTLAAKLGISERSLYQKLHDLGFSVAGPAPEQRPAIRPLSQTA
jgi:DNA-binding NtrC family response regulator